MAQSTDPGRIEQQFPPPNAPTPPSEIVVPQQEDLTAPPGADQQKFLLKSISIEGATIYPAERFESLYRERLNQEVSLKDLYAIAGQITQLYRRDGYVLSFALVPEQTITDGAVKLQVIEGYIEKIDLEGAPQAQLNRIKGFTDKILASRPLQIKDLERSMLLANDLAGVDVRSILRRGSSLGTSALLVRAVYDPINGFGELSNRGTREVGPLRAQVGLSLNSVLGQGEQVTLRGATALDNPSALALGSVGVSIPVGNDGLRLDLGTSYTTVNPRGALRDLGISGRTIVGEAGLSYPVVRSRKTNIIVKGSFDYSDSRSTFDLLGPRQVLSQDRLQVFRVGVDVENIDALGSFQGSFQLSQGINGTRPRNANEPLSRSAGSAVFTKVNLALTRNQTLPGQFNLLLSSKAQLTGDALLSRELFGLGGAGFGSAFDPDQLLGDYGYGLRVEVQRPFLYKAFKVSMTTQPYAFADYGQVFRNAPTAVENSSDSLASTGFGIRHSFNSSVFVGLELAFPLQRTDTSTDSDPRLFFIVTGFF